MSCFFTLDNFNLFSNMLVGLLSFIGIFGTGLFLSRKFSLVFPKPWHQIFAMLLGIQTLSLIVQLVSILQHATTYVLVTIEITFIFIGIVEIARFHIPKKLQLPQVSKLLLSILLCSLFINLIAASLPSTKIDELYYHMLLPSRIVQDHGLIFYLYPWLLSTFVQMFYSIALTPLHCMGFPHAGNIVSYCLSLSFLWFIYSVIYQYTNSANKALLIICTFSVGMYSSVWHVTSGSHVVGDLSLVCCVLALYFWEKLHKDIPIKHLAFLISFCAMTAASSKVSLFPITTIIILLVVYFFRKIYLSSKEYSIFLIILLPWIFLLPILTWTFIQSGSPFGAMMAGKFTSSIYNIEEIKLLISNSSNINRVPILTAIKSNSYFYSPLIFIILILGIKKLQKFIIGLFLIQTSIILLLLPPDVRFMGGLHYAVATASFIALSDRVQQFILKYSSILIFLFIMPWLAMQVYYIIPIVSSTIASEKEQQFNYKYIAFYQDFKELDKILPKNAQMLIKGVRLNSVYAPRSPIFHLSDVNPKQQLILFYVNQNDPGLDMEQFHFEKIYENFNAVIQTHRTPGRLPIRGKLQVFRAWKK